MSVSLLATTAAGEVPGERIALMGIPPAVLCSSMAQRLAAFVQAVKDDLDAGRRAQGLGPAVSVLVLCLMLFSWYSLVSMCLSRFCCMVGCPQVWWSPSQAGGLEPSWRPRDPTNCLQ